MLFLFCLSVGTSPRLGKLRKCSRHKIEANEMTFNSSESSGFDTELDGFDSSLSVSTNETTEIRQLQVKIALLEQILAQHSIPIPAPNAFPVS